MRAEPEAHAHGRAAESRGDREAGVPGAGVQEGLKTDLYAPPRARVDPAQQVGELWRRGALVRMDRTGALPDRCVVCNADAGGYRPASTLYCSPLAWRVTAVATPFVVAGLGAVGWFLPIVLVMMVAHVFMREKLKLEIGICERHRRWRVALRALGLACIAGVLASAVLWGVDPGHAATLLAASLIGMLLAGAAQFFLGLRGLALKELGDEHAWLAGTGKAFRAALPELPQ